MNICKQCGKEVTAEGRTLFCSAECQVKFYGKKIKSDYVKKEKVVSRCHYCGKKIIGTARKKYCNDKCRQKQRYYNGKKTKNKNYKKIPPTPTIKVCPNCEKEFVTDRNDKIYCCVKCQSEFGTKKNRKEKQIKICKWCDKEFLADRITNNYCSPECKKNRRRKRFIVKKIINKICKYCGKEFVANASNQIFCSIKCFNKYRYYIIEKPNYVPKEKIYKTKICKYCGKEFITHLESKKYCSPKCTTQFHKDAKRKSKNKICKNCGKEFIAYSASFQYCSPECKRIYVNLKRRKIIPVITSICQWCGKEIKYHRPRKFCNLKCNKEYNKKYKYPIKKENFNAKRRKEKIIKRCINCGNEFYTNKDYRKYCNLNCAKEYKNYKNKNV